MYQISEIIFHYIYYINMYMYFKTTVQGLWLTFCSISFSVLSHSNTINSLYIQLNNIKEHTIRFFFI